MGQSPNSLPAAEAWQPLPVTEWNAAAARHLLQRIGFSASPAELTRVLADGPEKSVERYFAAMPAFPKPRQIADIEADYPEIFRRISTGAPEEKRQAQQEAQVAQGGGFDPSALPNPASGQGMAAPEPAMAMAQ